MSTIVGTGGARTRPMSPDELEFLRAVSHELRAPLTVAIGHLELVEDHLGGGVIPLVVLDELTRMGRIIDDLLALALAGEANFLMPDTLDTIVLAGPVDSLTAGRSIVVLTWMLSCSSIPQSGRSNRRLTRGQQIRGPSPTEAQPPKSPPPKSPPPKSPPPKSPPPKWPSPQPPASPPLPSLMTVVWP